MEDITMEAVTAGASAVILVVAVLEATLGVGVLVAGVEISVVAAPQEMGELAEVFSCL
jgi:hypothetical protein